MSNETSTNAENTSVPSYSELLAEADPLLKLLVRIDYELRHCKDDIDTYDSDSEADHSDGRFCGRREAYADMRAMVAGEIERQQCYVI